MEKIYKSPYYLDCQKSNQKNYSLILIFLSFFIHSNLSAQSNYKPSDGIKISSNLLRNGFFIGLENPFSYKKIEKHKLRRIKSIYREKYNSYQLGYIHFKDVHYNYFAQYNLIFRRQKSKGLFTDLQLGGGINRTLIDGTVYKYKNGEFKKVFAAGNFYANANIGFEIGYNMFLKYQKPYIFYLRNQYSFLFPFNKFVVPQPTLELGFTYSFTVFKKSNLKYKLIQKGRGFKK